MPLVTCICVIKCHKIVRKARSSLHRRSAFLAVSYRLVCSVISRTFSLITVILIRRFTHDFYRLLYCFLIFLCTGPAAISRDSATLNVYFCNKNVQKSQEKHDDAKHTICHAQYVCICWQCAFLYIMLPDAVINEKQSVNQLIHTILLCAQKLTGDSANFVCRT